MASKPPPDRELLHGCMIMAVPALLILWSIYTGYTAVAHGRSASSWSWAMFIIVLAVVCIALAAFLGWLGTRYKHKTLGETIGFAVMVGLFVVSIIEVHTWASSHSDTLVKALGPACRGERVPEAAPITGAKKIFVLGDEGEKIAWTYQGGDWSAEKVEETALVACVSHKEEELESKDYTYSQGSTNVARTISRFADIATVRVVEARTGKLVNKFEVTDEPRELHDTEGGKLRDLHGSVRFSRVEPVLAAEYAGG